MQINAKNRKIANLQVDVKPENDANLEIASM